LSTSGAKLVSLKNNGTEKLYIDKDGYVSKPSGSLQHLIISSGDASGAAGTDAGNLTLKAGDAINADSASINGALYLIPGKNYVAGGTAYIYIGDTNNNIGTYYILVGNGTESNINLEILAKGSGCALTLGAIGGQVGTLVLNAVTTQPRGNIIFGNAINGIVQGAWEGSGAGHSITLQGGTSTQASASGGAVYIYGGTPGSGGVTGKIYIGTGSAGSYPLAGSGTGTSILLYNRSTGEITFGDK